MERFACRNQNSLRRMHTSFDEIFTLSLHRASALLGIFVVLTPRAAGLGIEPKFYASKAYVRPLDDPAMYQNNNYFDWAILLYILIKVQCNPLSPSGNFSIQRYALINP